jgi:hypothetical protein
MHKKRVITVFSLLVLFSAGLFVIQISKFGSITGNIVADTVEKSAELPFGVRISHLSVDNRHLVADIVFTSDKPTTLSVNSYVLSNGYMASSREDKLVVNNEFKHRLEMNLQPYYPERNQLILYANDGNKDIKLIKTVLENSVTGRAVDSVEGNPLYTGVSFLVGGCIILIVIFAIILIRKHRNESRSIRVLPQPSQRRFIEVH